MQNLVPLMLVPLIVWVAVWIYLWVLDAKVKRLDREMRQIEQGEDA